MALKNNLTKYSSPLKKDYVQKNKSSVLPLKKQVSDSASKKDSFLSEFKNK